MWWDGRLVGFDCESTGVSVETDRIVTAAVVACGGGRPSETQTWLIDPAVEIPDEAAAIHGVTTERARTYGDEARPAIAEILTMLSDRPEDTPIVVMNARFDLSLLDREARRYGLVPLQDRVDLLVVDAMVLDRHVDRYRRGSRKLDALCAHYGAGLDEAHDAGSDALAACRLAYVIGKRGEIVRRVRNAQDGREKAALVREWARVRGDLPALHEAQTRWARVQADGLREYFAAKGQDDDAAGVRGDWPLVNVAAVAA